MDLTRRGVRGEVALDIVVQDFGCVTLPIMAKVYQHADNSAAHGNQAGRWLISHQQAQPSCSELLPNALHCCHAISTS